MPIAHNLKLEYSLKRPKFLATCMYGIPFILLGNLAGNALAIGRYIMLAAGNSDASQGPVIGIAIFALSMVILVHMCTRRGGILLNNIFAVLKVIFLLAIVVIGFAFRGDDLTQKDHIGDQNFSSRTSFAEKSRSFASYTESLLVVMYTYSGYEQPFYVSSGISVLTSTF
jgi:L-asparagine transporter-like permease